MKAITAAENLMLHAERGMDLASLFEDAVTGMAIVGLHGRFEAVNPALCRLLGYPADELVGRSTVEVTHPEDRPRSQAVFARLLSGRAKTDQAHKRYVRSDGSFVTVVRTTTVLRDAKGGPTALFTQIVDVTALAEMQEIVSGSEQRFRKLVTHASDVILLLDRAGRIRYASAAAERVLGYPPERLEGHDALGFIHADDHDRARSFFARQTAATGPDTQFGYRIRHRDGTWREFEVVGTSLFDDPTISALVLNLRDVTEQAEYQRRLEVGERRFRTLVANSWDIISLHDAAGRYVFCSPAASQLGYQPEELIGTSPTEIIHPEDRPLVAEAFGAMIAGGSESLTIEYRVRHRDGRWRWLESIGESRLDDPAVASIVVTSRDVTQRRLRVRQQQAVAELGQAALRGGPVAELLDRIPATVTEALAVPGCLLVRFELDGTRTVVASSDVDERLFGECARRLCNEALEHRGPAVWKRGEGHPSPADPRDGDCGGVAVPVTPATGAAGVLAVYSSDPDGLGPNDIAFLETVASIVAAALTRHGVEEELRRQAVHDRLTELPNRALLMDRLSTALSRLSRRHGQVAVLFVDLDNFKLINDSLGHSLGDSVVASVARRLRAAVRLPDTVARFGGDEFVIVSESDDPAAVRDLADRIRRVVSAPLVVAQRSITVTASIGYASTTDADTSPDSLLADADMAMYEAKRAGKNAVAQFAPELRRRTTDHLDAVSGIRRGIEAGEFRLFYQPIYDLTSVTPMAHEALLRWERPTSGLVLPGQFIGYAESSDLILPLGRWVLRTACAQSAEWSRQGRPAKVTINVSARQLTGSDIAGEVAAAIADSGARAGDIYLEVTESALITDLDAARAALEALRALGVHLGLDDFGTGWSSLSQLAHLPFDFVKIDRCFVRDLETVERTAALLESMVGLCFTLGLDVIVEGVETAAQLAHVESLDVRLVQGFLLGRPAPPDQVNQPTRPDPAG
ncbi:MAG: EAL domain-containing protein [Acidobacteriota bacterium]|nr:EAL domain-containing protein [Acidobacteriota bacterium]